MQVNSLISFFSKACATHLNQSSVNFSNHLTFGWFTFLRDNKKSDAVNDGVLVFKLACYECSNYDVDGSNPGTAINEATEDVIDSLNWKKEDAAAQGKDLIVQFETFLKSQNATTTATPKSTSPSSTTELSSKDKDAEANNEKVNVNASNGNDTVIAKANSKTTSSSAKDSNASTAVDESTTAQNVTTSTTKDQSS